MIFRNFNHWWGNSKALGLTSASLDWGKEIWEELEPTIEATLDDYKKAYIELMEERTAKNSELVNEMLTYIKEFKQPDAPKFWKWYLDRKTGKKDD